MSMGRAEFFQQLLPIVANVAAAYADERRRITERLGGDWNESKSLRVEILGPTPLELETLDQPLAQWPNSPLLVAPVQKPEDIRSAVEADTRSFVESLSE